MNKKEGSSTAEVVAFGRSYHSLFDNQKIFDDYLARHMLSDHDYDYIEKRIASFIGLLEPFNQFKYKRQEGGAVRRMVQRLICPAPLARNKYVEDYLEEAVEQGIDQYVIMGAGYDTYGLRRKDKLEHLKVFEVDHPSTQNKKLSRIQSLQWDIHPNHVFVPVDFDEDNFKDKLLEAGFDPSKKTLFTWLGVTYYLTKEAITNTLRDIETMSPKGSRVIFDYPDRKFYNPLKTTWRVTIMVMLVKKVNEPMRVGYEPEEIIQELNSLGYTVEEHLDREAIQAKYFANRKDDYSAFENINIMCAEIK